MPMFVLNTNVPSVNLPRNFSASCAQLVADLLSKPVQKVIVSVHADQLMTFGGTAENCASIDFHSWGKISPEENRNYAKVVAEFLETNLKIPKNRCYISFQDQDPHMLGVLGTTRAAI